MLSYQLRVAVLGLSCRGREAQISFYSCRFWGWHYSPHCLSKGSWEQLRDIACAPCIIACYPSWTWQKQLTKQASRRHRRHILDSELRTLSLSETPYTHQRKLVSAACVCNLLAVAEGASKSTALLSHSATLSLPQQTGATSSSQQMVQTSVCHPPCGNWPADTVQKRLQVLKTRLVKVAAPVTQKCIRTVQLSSRWNPSIKTKDGVYTVACW